MMTNKQDRAPYGDIEKIGFGMIMGGLGSILLGLIMSAIPVISIASPLSPVIVIFIGAYLYK